MNKDFQNKANIILFKYHAFSDIKTGEGAMKNDIFVKGSF